MRGSQSTHGLSGDGYYKENSVLGRFVFFKRFRRQKWSPAAHEIEVECGLRLGRWRFSITSSKIHWVNENTVEKRRMWL